MNTKYIIKSEQGYFTGPHYTHWTKYNSLALKFTHSDVKEEVKNLSSIGHRCEVRRVE